MPTSIMCKSGKVNLANAFQYAGQNDSSLIYFYANIY
jgi:hypothetical protein